MLQRAPVHYKSSPPPPPCGSFRFLSGNNLRDMTELVGLFDGLTELIDL